MTGLISGRRLKSRLREMPLTNYHDASITDIEILLKSRLREMPLTNQNTHCGCSSSSQLKSRLREMPLTNLITAGTIMPPSPGHGSSGGKSGAALQSLPGSQAPAQRIGMRSSDRSHPSLHFAARSRLVRCAQVPERLPSGDHQALFLAGPRPCLESRVQYHTT